MPSAKTEQGDKSAMSSYYTGSQEREWPEQDPDWCYFCDRPLNDCACPQEERIERIATDLFHATSALMDALNNAYEANPEAFLEFSEEIAGASFQQARAEVKRLLAKAAPLANA